MQDRVKLKKSDSLGVRAREAGPNVNRVPVGIFIIVWPNRKEALWIGRTSSIPQSTNNPHPPRAEKPPTV